MKTRSELLDMRCSPSTGAKALTRIDIDLQLAVMPGWSYADGAINRTYKFGNYHETIDFVNALADVVHANDHHPDLFVSYNRCTVALNTHDVKGISENDFIIAAHADALYQSRS
jgi:4a-hydroxytetrahydrobiopterin dehydratase